MEEKEMNNGFQAVILNAEEMAQPAQPAQPKAQPQFVTDILTLGNDAMTWLIAISAVVAVVFGIFFIMKWYKADDNEKPAAMKKVQGVIMGAVGVVIFEAFLKLVLSYFIH